MATTLTITVTTPDNPHEMDIEFKNGSDVLARVTWNVLKNTWSGFEMTLNGINEAFQLIEVILANVPAFYPDVDKVKLVNALNAFDQRIQADCLYLEEMDAQQSLGLF